MFLLKAYIANHKFFVICIPETYFDSSTPSDNNNLEISGYTFVRSELKLVTKLVTFYLSTDTKAEIKMTLKLLNLENLVQRNLFLVVAIRDFNAKLSNRFCKDKTNFEGDAIENLTSLSGLQEVIKEPTRILDTSSLCIDLIFTSQPDLIIESEVHSSLHSNCHHQIIFAKFNLEVVYPLHYVQQVSYYKDANT